MASKQNQLVQTLLDQNQQLNATQLANSLGVSVRTVHNYINAVNAQYQDAIVSTPTGYRIAPAMAQQMLHQSPNDIPQNAQDRCTYILNRLVQKGGSLNLYDLCDEIYISATTFHSLMGKMRRLTREYDLSLAVSGDTVTLTGSERNKRRLLSGLLYHESASAFTSTDSLQAAFPSIDIEKIRADVMDVLNENHYFINDYSLLNLLLHIAIAINRVQNGCVYAEAPSTMHPLDPQNERLAQELTKRLARNFNIRFSAAEQYEMALLLVSRTSMLDYAAITPDNIADYIGNDCTDLVHQLINTVKDFYDINLDEPEFFIRFALHTHNLLVRAQNRSFCKNPLVSEIRQSCPLIYDVSVQLSGIIREKQASRSMRMRLPTSRCIWAVRWKRRRNWQTACPPCCTAPATTIWTAALRIASAAACRVKSCLPTYLQKRACLTSLPAVRWSSPPCGPTGYWICRLCLSRLF